MCYVVDINNGVHLAGETAGCCEQNTEDFLILLWEFNIYFDPNQMW